MSRFKLQKDLWETGPPTAQAAGVQCRFNGPDRADIADPAYLQNLGLLITGARSLTPADSVDSPFSLTTSSQQP